MAGFKIGYFGTDTKYGRVHLRGTNGALDKIDEKPAPAMILGGLF